jgi:hypothetical protein
MNALGVAVDGAHVYWANGRAIGRANLDGTGFECPMISGVSGYGVVVDALGPPPSNNLGPFPSNEFRFGKAKRKKERGSAKLTVKVPGPGQLKLAKTKYVQSKHKHPSQSVKLRLSVRPRGKAEKRLNKRGKVKVKAKVTFAPPCVASSTKSKKITLVKR